MLLFKNFEPPPLWGGYGEEGYSENIFPEVPPKSDKHPHKPEFSIYYSFSLTNVGTFKKITLYIEYSFILMNYKNDFFL